MSSDAASTPAASSSSASASASFPSPDDVLNFWFPPSTSLDDTNSFRREWWQKDPAFDDSIRQRFGRLVEAALDREEGSPWGVEGDASMDDVARARRSLAHIILLDQFTRNIYRGSPRSFAGDARALTLAKQLVASGLDQLLPPVQRGFVYMPFEHSESLSDQDEAIRLFQSLPGGDKPEHMLTDFARRHQVIIQRFGRFPHRNNVLGRESTEEEVEFLKQPGSSF